MTALKAEIQRRLAEQRRAQATRPASPAPRYDEVFWEGVTQLNEGQGMEDEAQHENADPVSHSLSELIERLHDADSNATPAPWWSCSCNKCGSVGTDNNALLETFDEWGDDPKLPYGRNGHRARIGNRDLIPLMRNGLRRLLHAASEYLRLLDLVRRLQHDLDHAEKALSGAGSIPAVDFWLKQMRKHLTQG